MSSHNRLILASGSPRRLQLLQQIGIQPDNLRPVNIDETPEKGELPRKLAKRLSLTKAEVAVREVARNEETRGCYVLTADTVVGVGRRIIDKAEFAEDASHALRMLSGRAHRVYTGVCLANPEGKIAQKIVETRIRFKRLNEEDINAYLASGEWRGKAGAYAIQGLAGSFVIKLTGSYSNVVGLPLYETMALLKGMKFPVHMHWLSGVAGD
ncbi:MAG: septum formation inhibitor Maf [Hyphomicrobiales bacterium]|nr:MAG: septum formation inhibitor Maf [Hyphomicrobiales bacterium]